MLDNIDQHIKNSRLNLAIWTMASRQLSQDTDSKLK